MPWKAKNEQEQRYELVRGMEEGRESITELSRRWRVSRKTAYKWRKRYRQKGLSGLLDRSRKPMRVARQTARCWLERLRRLRKKRSTWGARKLHHRLGQELEGTGLPSVATIGRWLRRWGLAKGRRRRLAGPVIAPPARRVPQEANEIWTVDFKGWYRTGDGTRVDPLTVRDLYSRYGLRVALLPDESVAVTRREFKRIFRRYGLPQRIRCDNGVPFGGGGFHGPNAFERVVGEAGYRSGIYYARPAV